MPSARKPKPKAEEIPTSAKNGTKATKATTKAKQPAQLSADATCPPPPPSSAASEAVVPISCSASKRRLERRDTDEQVERAMKTKFYDQGYDESFISALRNAKGESIFEIISDEIKSTRGVRKYLATGLWRKLFQAFPLKHGMFAILPAGGEGHVPEGLEDALLHAYSENPAARTIDPFKRYLDIAPKPDRDILLATIRACGEGPIIGRNQSHGMLLAVLQYIGKHQSHREFPDVWDCISSHMDAHMTMRFKAWPLDEESYVGGHMTSLSALVNELALLSVSSAIANGEAINPDHLQDIMNTIDGSAIFAKEAITFRHSIFINSRGDMLKDWLGNSFHTDEVHNFKTIMVREASHLTKSGVKPYEQKESMFKFLQETVTCSVTSLHDDWEFGLMAMAKTMALSQNKTPRLPWEMVCFGRDAAIPAVSTTVEIPTELLKMNSLARSSALKLFAGLDVATLTFAQMKSEMSKKRTELCQLDRSFVQELAFLFEIAEPFVERSVHDKLLGCFPDADTPCTMDQTLKAAQKIKQSHMVHASRSTLAKEVDSVVNFVLALGEGQPPAFASFALLSHFFKSIVHRAEFYVTTSRKKPLEPGKLFQVTETLHGRQALELMYSDFIEQDGESDIQNAKILQAFRWLLTDEQNAKVLAKVKDIIRSRRSLLTVKAIEATAASDSKGGAASSSSSSGIHSTAMVVKSVLKIDIESAMTPKEVAKAEADQEARARLRDILRGKSSV